jgi:mono/diheme cytochrome c family protein
MMSAALSLALLGCGGGDKGGDTTPATTEQPADATEETDPQVLGEMPDPPGGDAEAAAGGGLSAQLEQANKVWGDSCATCHGDKGEGKGKKNPAVVGGKALTRHKNGGELLTYIKEKMPKDDPGSLSEADYLAVTAWVLSQNGRLGETDVPVTAASAASISLQ